MSFLKGSSNMSVVRYTGDVPTLDETIDAFNANVLIDPKDVTSEICGWTNSLDILRRHFTMDDAVGQWFHCNYVKCVCKIPSALRKVHVTSALEEYKIVHGKYPKGADRQKIEDDVEKKLAPFAVPTFKTIPVLINTSTGYIYIGTNKIDAADDVVGLIRRTFETKVITVEFSSSFNILISSALGKMPEDSLAGYHAYDVTDPVELLMTYELELISWLYGKWEKSGAIRDAELLFEEGMTLTNLSNVGPGKVTLGKGEKPLEGPVVFELFRKNYLLSGVNLHVVPNGGSHEDFRFGLDENLTLMKVTPPKKISLEERFEYFANAFDAWKELVISEYASLRFDAKLWKKEVADFRDLCENRITKAILVKVEAVCNKLEEA